MFLIKLWSLITLRPLLQCTTCVASHVHVRGHTPCGWSRLVLVISHHLSLWCVEGLDTVQGRTGRPLVGAAVITVNSDYTTPAELSVWWSIHTVWARQRDSEWIIVSMNGAVKWSSLVGVGVRGSELSDDIYRARSRQLANADQYCTEITCFEDTAKHPLTTALPENRPPNRNRGFFLKTEPKPTDLGQCETVTTLNIGLS